MLYGHKAMSIRLFYTHARNAFTRPCDDIFQLLLRGCDPARLEEFLFCPCPECSLSGKKLVRVDLLSRLGEVRADSFPEKPHLVESDED